MTDLCIPIESLDDDGFRGVIRESGMPDLIAHRPEPSRFLRLARVVGAVKAIAAKELGPEAAPTIITAMISVSDEKGDFTFVWRKALHRPEYEQISARALHLENETEIAHIVVE